MTGLESDSPKKNPLTAEHTIYKIGRERVPSVTGIIGSNLGWKYPALLGWTKKMLRQGVYPDAAASEAGTVGSLVHRMIEARFTGRDVDFSFYSNVQRILAQTSYNAFLLWWKHQNYDVEMAERQLTHGSLRYGGTIDLLCSYYEGKKKVLTLIDFKSSTNIYLDHRIQAAAYQQLVLHRYKKLPRVIILHLNKENGVPTPHEYPDLTQEWSVFKLCLKLNKIHSLIS